MLTKKKLKIFIFIYRWSTFKTKNTPTSSFLKKKILLIRCNLEIGLAFSLHCKLLKPIRKSRQKKNNLIFFFLLVKDKKPTQCFSLISLPSAKMASVASSPISFAASFLRTKPFPLSPRFLPIRTLRCALSSEPIEFDISFAPPKPTPSSPRGNTAFQQLFIPWIVRGEDGKLKVQSQPPAHLIHALADATTQNPKKKVKKKKPQASSSSSAVTSSSTSEPKLSKAARRYYNENIKEPPQRLSKVLAAAGGKQNQNLLDWIIYRFRVWLSMVWMLVTTGYLILM